MKICEHCGRTANLIEANVNGHWVCHPNEGLDCYRLVTIYREPLGARLPGGTLVDTVDPIRAAMVGRLPMNHELDGQQEAAGSWEDQLEREAAIDLCGDTIRYQQGDVPRDENDHPLVYVHVRWAQRQHRLRARLEAFSRTCVEHGDMTPGAARMLTRILKEEQ